MAFKMKGSAFLKDVKMYEGDGSVITIDDANLGKVYVDDDGMEVRDYTYTTKDGKKGIDVLYLNKPWSEELDDKPPRWKPTMPERPLA